MVRFSTSTLTNLALYFEKNFSEIPLNALSPVFCLHCLMKLFLASDAFMKPCFTSQDLSLTFLVTLCKSFYTCLIKPALILVTF